MPPCPEWIHSREKQALWAKVAAILSTRHPMKAGKIRHLEDAFRDLISAPYPSPSHIARKVNMRWIKEATQRETTKPRQNVNDTPEDEE